MDNKAPYITGRLHRIGDRLAERAGVQPPATPETPVQQPKVVETPSLRPEVLDALKSRKKEFVRLKRDVLTRLGAAQAAISAEETQLEARKADLTSALAKFKELQDALTPLEEPDLTEAGCQQQLSTVFKAVEHARLELIMEQTKLEKSALVKTGQPGQQQGGAHDSILPEMNSLTFKQLFRFGLILTLPIASAILIGGFLVALAIIIAMRLGL